MKGTMVYVERGNGACAERIKGTITVAAMIASGQSHLYIVELERQAEYDKRKKDRVAVEISTEAERHAATRKKLSGEGVKVLVRLAYEGVEAERVERQLRDVGVSDWTALDGVSACRIDVRTLNGLAGDILVIE